MESANPFIVDAAAASEREMSQLTLRGATDIRAFCNADETRLDWNERGACVLKARRGFGKSHLLMARSANHRDGPAAGRTLFYPSGGHPRLLFDALTNLHAAVPGWMKGKDAVPAWVDAWQLAILGLLVWHSQARSEGLRGYDEWFGNLKRLDQIAARQAQPHQSDVQSAAMLGWFMGRVLEQLPVAYQEGRDQLKRGLYHAGSDWALAIKEGLASLGKTRIAMYLDAPDEMVDKDPVSLWRGVQQGLLLAIWKFAKAAMWSDTLLIYATVRSEAFGTADEHPDVSLAMGLVLSLRYSASDLRAMLFDRIRRADASRLAKPLAEAMDPLEALCGFSQVVHDDRQAVEGGPYVETVFDSILRHTRRVPREVIGLAAAIYGISDKRTVDTVRTAVNAEAGVQIGRAIEHSFFGWSDSLHRPLAQALRSEMLSTAAISEIASRFGPEGLGAIKFFVRHGMLGTAEPQPKRHQNYYVQRFAYDEVHGGEDASSLDRDYFFVHPAFKEWIQSPAGQLGRPMTRMAVGAVGDQLGFEARPPWVRLGLVNGAVSLNLGTGSRLSATARNVKSDPLKFLFVTLWTCREQRRMRVNLAEIRDAWCRLLERDDLRHSLVPGTGLAPDPEDMADQVRDWIKKINNRDSQVLQLRATLSKSHRKTGRGRAARAARSESQSPFIAMTVRSSIGAIPEVYFPLLPLNELDVEPRLWSIVQPNRD
ncbi:hypothetical protein [Ramlibacter sp.]|uniref:hypothetical protein n=1 Tax=Ramlibacter sp. TaxID=1917967 RepID=UPI0035B21E84